MPTHHIQTEIDRIKILTVIQALKEGVHWIVEIKRYRKKRTISQNSLLHKWLACISDETGNILEDTKNAYKEKFLPSKTVEIFGDTIEIRTGTHELNTKQMTDFMNLIEADAAGEGIVLPHPDDMHWESFEENYKDYIG